MTKVIIFTLGLVWGTSADKLPFMSSRGGGASSSYLPPNGPSTSYNPPSAAPSSYLPPSDSYGSPAGEVYGGPQADQSGAPAQETYGSPAQYEDEQAGYGGDLNAAASDEMSADEINMKMLMMNVPGDPGIDYPIFGIVPDTAFNCEGKVVGGYYSDPGADCQAFHVCATSDNSIHSKYSFLCPNGTIFNQEIFICDWWFNFDCSEAEGFYTRNDDIASEQAAISSAASNNSPQYGGDGGLSNPQYEDNASPQYEDNNSPQFDNAAPDSSYGAPTEPPLTSYTPPEENFDNPAPVEPSTFYGVPSADAPPAYDAPAALPSYDGPAVAPPTSYGVPAAGPLTEYVPPGQSPSASSVSSSYLPPAEQPPSAPVSSYLPPADSYSPPTSSYVLPQSSSSAGRTGRKVNGAPLKKQNRKGRSKTRSRSGNPKHGRRGGRQQRRNVKSRFSAGSRG